MQQSVSTNFRRIVGTVIQVSEQGRGEQVNYFEKIKRLDRRAGGNVSIINFFR